MFGLEHKDIERSFVSFIPALGMGVFILIISLFASLSFIISLGQDSLQQEFYNRYELVQYNAEYQQYLVQKQVCEIQEQYKNDPLAALERYRNLTESYTTVGGTNETQNCEFQSPTLPSKPTSSLGSWIMIDIMIFIWLGISMFLAVLSSMATFLITDRILKYNNSKNLSFLSIDK